MTQKVLYYPEIGATVKHMGGKRMAYNVGEDSEFESCLAGVFSDNALDAALYNPVSETV